MDSATKLNREIEIMKLLGLMAAAYPNTQIAEATLNVYVSMLKDLSVDVLTLAVQQAMAESEFLPTIARIREKALALTQQTHVSSLEAWGQVKRAMESVGYYRSPTFADPLITKAVDCIGWQTLCTSENEPADRAHFSKVYESLVRREEEDSRLLPEVRQIQQRVRALIAEGTMPEGGFVN